MRTLTLNQQTRQDIEKRVLDRYQDYLRSPVLARMQELVSRHCRFDTLAFWQEVFRLADQTQLGRCVAFHNSWEDEPTDYLDIPLPEGFSVRLKPRQPDWLSITSPCGDELQYDRQVWDWCLSTLLNEASSEHRTIEIRAVGGEVRITYQDGDKPVPDGVSLCSLTGYGAFLLV